jgi:hypothetical protein
MKTKLCVEQFNIFESKRRERERVRKRSRLEAKRENDGRELRGSSFEGRKNIVRRSANYKSTPFLKKITNNVSPLQRSSDCCYLKK